MKKVNQKKNKIQAAVIKIFLILFFLSSELLSQTRVDSLEYLGRFFNQNLLNSIFDKQLNTFHLVNQLQLVKDYNDLIIRLNENFNSTFIRSDSKNTRDEQTFNLTAKYKINKNIFLGINANSSLLSDNRSLGINESAVNSASFFSDWEVMPYLRLNPFGGYSSNRQIGITDNGFLYGLEGLLNNLSFSDLLINSYFRYKNEDVLPRRNLIRYFALSVNNSFEKGIANNIRTYYSQTRKDFYFNADPITSSEFNISKNIQSRTETSYQLFDRLSYDEFLDLFSLDLVGGINWRSIDRDIKYKTAELQTNSLYDTKIDEIKLEFAAIARYNSRIFNGSIRLNIDERDEKHSVKRFESISEQLFEQKTELEEQKNNNSNRVTIALNGDLKISQEDFLTFSLYQSKLVYDTKSILNDDDRDELLSIIRLRYLRNLNSYFSVFINTEYTSSHTVYIFASRSSNNKKNRILRLRTGGDYIGKNFSSFNSFEVSANYTVYDFEDITSNYQSYSFRQFTAIDSTTIDLTEKLKLFTFAYLKLSEVGDFSWNSFSTKPTRILKEIYFEPRFILNYLRSNFSIGLRLFILDTYSYKIAEKQLESEYLSIGPIAAIDIYVWNRINLIIKGYYEFITNTNVPDKEQASLIMQVNWKF
ncbi:MAG: hypothetical protein ROY99_12400 [Ignavibacterium sp.]|nr:hypothetical protein [Ignavibacterium sp.]